MFGEKLSERLVAQVEKPLIEVRMWTGEIRGFMDKALLIETCIGAANQAELVIWGPASPGDEPPEHDVVTRHPEADGGLSDFACFGELYGRAHLRRQAWRNALVRVDEERPRLRTQIESKVAKGRKRREGANLYSIGEGLSNCGRVVARRCIDDDEYLVGPAEGRQDFGELTRCVAGNDAGSDPRRA